MFVRSKPDSFGDELRLEQAAADRVARQFGDVAHPELVKDAGAMMVDGLAADHELDG